MRRPLLHALSSFLLLSPVALTACNSGLPACRSEVPVAAAKTDYVLVDYHWTSNTNGPPKVDVSKTPTYDRERMRLNAAAIRFPDRCLNAAAKDVSGARPAGADDSIFHTTCGSWFSELEKALTEAGFKVFSWDALRQREIQEKISTYQAAKELHADVVFVFNDLDAGPVKAGGKASVSRKYFESDETGRRGPPKSIENGPRAALHDFVDQHEGPARAKEVTLMTSILDTTAILVNSSGDSSKGEHSDAGESIWFYRRAFRFPVGESDITRRYLFATEDGGQKWTPAWPVGIPRPTAPVQPTASTEDSSSDSVADSTDAYAEERLQVVRAAAQSFVQSFRNGVTK